MDRKGLTILVLAAIILFLLFAPKSSGFEAAAGVSGHNLGNTLPSMYGGGYGHSSSAMNKLDGHGYPYAGSDGPSADGVSSASLIPQIGRAHV